MVHRDDSESQLESAFEALLGAMARTPERPVPPSVADLERGRRVGRYELVELLGRGGMGAVYRAHDDLLGREVALKVILAGAAGSQVDRFRREIMALAAVSHPNVVAVHDAGVDGDLPYLVLDLVKGQTLRARLKAGPLEIDDLYRLARDLVLGLGAVHAVGIVHRDLKPDNVLLDEGQTARLVDFGLARLVEPETAAAHGMTESGAFLGTAEYMAPEQVRGESVDHRADYFALGAVLYEAVTGRRAFEAATPAEAIAAVLRDHPATDPALLSDPHARHLLGVALRCLEKTPAQRFQSTTELLHAIEQPAGASLERRSWSDVFAELSSARDKGKSGALELERLALAAYMLGRDAECQDAWTGAYQGWLQLGEPERAARCTFWHALGLFFRGDAAPAIGWVGRGARLLEQSGRDCVERAWLGMIKALPLLFKGDVDAAYPTFVEAAEIAARFADPDATLFARLGQGHARILQGRIDEGMALLDEVMVAVVADEVAPLIAGIAYCAVITRCQAVFDVRRAMEWTQALTRWCDSQPDLVPFQGSCLIHRCEIFQLRGAWGDALDAAQRACERLMGPPAWDTLGSAYYQLAEIQRLRGDFARAEESYRQASLAGRDPEPGMSLLRLAQGRTDLAVPAIRRALEEAGHDPIGRSRLLPACVVVMLSATDVGAARVAADELAALADRFDVPYLHALAAEASGAVLLAERDPRAALTKLRAAYRSWRELEAPHPAACVRLLIGVACRELGDGASAELDFEAARRVLEELGAVPDLERLARARA